MEILSHPEEKLCFVHVAGTNGKGSVCAYISSILIEAGHVCGVFTSPYIERFEERIRINEQDISYQDLLEATLVVRDAACEVERRLGEHPTEFELMCAVALVHFARKECDIVVMEVGLGGRLDSTNIIIPELSVISRIGLDHMSILGDTLRDIAREKAGIIKRGIDVVSCPQAPDALGVIRQRCDCMDSELLLVEESDIVDAGIDIHIMKRRFAYKGIEFSTGLLGRYQLSNAAVAIEAAMRLGSKWGIDLSFIQRGIEKAKWSSRFEIVSMKPLIIVDGAHNPDGVCALASSLEDISAAANESFEAGIDFIVGVLADKDYEDMIDPLIPMASTFSTYAPDNPRRLPSDELAHFIERSVAEKGLEDVIDVFDGKTASDAMESVLKKAGPESIIVAFGTLYSIADLKCTIERLL